MDEISIDTTQVDQTLDDIVSAFDDMSYEAPFRATMIDWQEHHQEAFMQGHGPGDDVWPELAEATKKRKGHGVKLIEEGDLEASLVSNTPDSIREIVDEPTSPGFSFGTRDEKAHRHQHGTKHMPARPPVGVTDQQIDQLTDRIADHLVGEILGGL